MTLSEYTYIVTLGQTCANNFQLARAAHAARLPPERCTGPFDWISLDVRQAIRVIETDLVTYFSHDGISLAPHQDPNDHWGIVEAHGIQSRHQLEREGDEPAPTAKSWFDFGKWLGHRLRAWQTNLADASGRLLFIREENAFAPDDPADIARLATVLSEKAAGKVMLAWVRFARGPVEVEHPNLRSFHVRTAWPAELRCDEVDWMHDYGMGLAWRGHNVDWDAVYAAL